MNGLRLFPLSALSTFFNGIPCVLIETDMLALIVNTVITMDLPEELGLA